MQPGAVRIECEDDLWRHYSLSRGWMHMYTMEDNTTCVHPPKPGAVLSRSLISIHLTLTLTLTTGPNPNPNVSLPFRTLSLTLTRPGWGGSYAGSKPRCFASHDMGKKAQPEACRFDKPFSMSESWEPQGKFPYPHPKDAERGEKWVKG